MPRLNVGIGSVELSSDQLIQAWEMVREEKHLLSLVDEQLPKLFRYPANFWGLTQDASQVCLSNLLKDDVFSSRSVDYRSSITGFREHFKEGATLLIAAYSTIRLIQGGEDPKPYDVPTKFEPVSSDIEFFTENSTISGLFQSLVRLNLECKGVKDLVAAYGVEFGGQFAIEVLDQRYHWLKAEFDRTELDNEAVFIEV